MNTSRRQIALAAVVWTGFALGAAVVFKDMLIDHARAFLRRGHLAWKGDQIWYRFPDAALSRRSWTADHAFLDPALDWQPLEPGLELAHLELRRDPNPQTCELWVLRVDPARWGFQVLAAPDFASLPVSQHAGDLPAAFNASYFSAQGPLGLVVQDGMQRNRQSQVWAAHLLDGPGGPRIAHDKDLDPGDATQVVQAFPAIMTGGETYPYMRYGNRGFPVHELARRTAVCVDRQDQVRVVVTESLANGLTLNELATVLGGLGCVDAMGLDGGSSTALWVPGAGVDVQSRDGVPVALGLSPRQ